MKSRIFCAFCACVLLLGGLMGAASASSLGETSADAFVPALNEALAASPLAERVDASDPAVDEEGRLGYYVCKDTYLMLTPADGDTLSRVTLTLLSVGDLDKAEQLLQSTIQATMPEGLPAEEISRIAGTLDLRGLVAGASGGALTRCDAGATTYTLETLPRGVLLCVENR